MKKIAANKNYRLVKEASVAEAGWERWAKDSPHLDADKIDALKGLSGLMAPAIDLIKSNAAMGRSPSVSTDDEENDTLQTYLNDIANLISSERWPKPSSS